MPNEIRWLDDDELTAWRTFLRAQSNVTSAVDRELSSAHGLGLADYEVLSHLCESPERSLRMTELARSVLLSPSGLTRRLDGLVKGGYVERQPCPSDGRGLLAVLTKEGKDKAMEMLPTHARAVREHFVSCMERRELQDLIRVLEPVANQSGSRCADVRDTTEQQINADTGETGAASQVRPTAAAAH